MRLIDADALKRLVDEEWFDCREKYSFFNEINRTPTIETVYGYQLKVLAYIAAVMAKKGVTAEEAVDIFKDMSSFVEMYREEQKEIFEESMYYNLLKENAEKIFVWYGTAERNEE